jgi:hypothetical protein
VRLRLRRRRPVPVEPERQAVTLNLVELVEPTPKPEPPPGPPSVSARYRQAQAIAAWRLERGLSVDDPDAEDSHWPYARPPRQLKYPKLSDDSYATNHPEWLIDDPGPSPGERVQDGEVTRRFFA